MFLLSYFLIRHTEIIKIAVAILIIFTFSLAADTFELVRTASVLKITTQTLLTGMIVIFYPELRSAFAKFTKSSKPLPPELSTLKQLEKAVFELSKQNIGALILLDEKGEVSALAEHATKIGARCSSELLQTLFYPNTPLHDGAVIVRNGKVEYAGCKLPLTARKKRNLGTLGTRHLVACEMAERFQCTAIVVSEETGIIRIASKDRLTAISTKEEFYRLF